MKKILFLFLLCFSLAGQSQTFPVNNLQVNGAMSTSAPFAMSKAATAVNCTGSGSDNAAISSALSISNTLRIPSGSSCVITANLTIPTGTEIYFDAGASVSVSTGATLTINGIVHAPLNTIFTGVGTVTGIGEVWPEWWGATGTGSAHNDAAAIQAAENSMEAAGNVSDGNRILHFRPVSYGVGSTILITPPTTEKITWVGAGSYQETNFLGLASFTGTSVLQVVGSAPGTATDFELKGFSVTPQTVGTGATQGIRFGSSATNRLVGGQHPSLVSDIYVADFGTDIAIQDVRLITFLNISGWCISNTSCTPLSITSSASASSFTGDLTFVSGQFVAPFGTLTQDSIFITSSGPSGAAVAGIRFIGTIAYYGAILIEGSSSGFVHDIWLESGFQLDATTNFGLIIGAGSSAQVTDIHIDNSYFFGSGTNSTPLLDLFSTGGGATTSIFVNGNIFAGSTSATAFEVSGVSQFNFTGNKLQSMSVGTNPVFTITGSSTFQINENAISASTYGTLVTVSAGQDYYTVRSNMCGGGFSSSCVNNAAAGAHSIVDGNF